MAFETATILGMLGINFYLIYLANQLREEHPTLKVGLVLASFLTVLITLGTIHNILLHDATAHADVASMGALFYQVWTWLSYGFVSWWFIMLAGRWITSWLKTQK